jgi:predicted nucleotidyltransferase
MADSQFDIDLDAVRAFLTQKDERRELELDERFERARGDFAFIVERILARHSPRRIYQWGSLLSRKKFTQISDIDVAVEGLAGPEYFFALLGDVMSLSEFPLDIVELEKVGPENAQYIKENGRLIYERKP